MSTADTILTLITGAMLGWAAREARDIWLTRRQPVRRDAPTGNEPWTQPDPFWRD